MCLDDEGSDQTLLMYRNVLAIAGIIRDKHETAIPFEPKFL